MDLASWLRRLTRLPEFPDTHSRRLAVIVRDLLLSALVLVLAVAALLHPLADEPLALWVLDLGIAGTAVVGLAWLRQGRLRHTGILLVCAVWVIEVVALMFSGEMDGPALAIVPLLVVCAGLFWSLRAAAWLALASALIAAGVSLLQSRGLLPEALFPVTAVRQYSGLVGALVMAWVLVHLIQQVQRDTRDDTERAASRFAELVEGSPDGILSLDDEGRVLTANSALRVLLGRERPLEAGLTIGEQVHLEDHQVALIAEELQAVLAHRQRPPLELSLSRPDGRRVDVECKSRPIAGEDGNPAVQVTIRDVTARRQAEQRRRELEHELARSQRLESIGRLSAGIAHDFNNLLTVMLSSAELLVDGFEREGAPEAWRGDADRICSAAQRAARLVERLLAFGRQQPLAPETLDAGLVACEVSELLGRLLGETIEVVVDLPPHVPLVFADRAGLEQAVVNLSINARDAMPGGGRLTIALASRETDGSDDARVPAGSWVVLAVTDTGEGMSAAVQEQVFDPFFSTKAVGEGTGLGLSSVHGFVTQSHGHVLVDSAPGEGTRFEILLPAVAEQGRVSVAERDPAAASGVGRPGGDGQTILVVEDEPSVREIQRRILSAAGYDVVLAANGELGWHAFEADPARFAVVVSDMTMPVMGGAELARRVRALRPDIPMLFVSGLAQRAPTGGPSAILGKPFTAEQLLDALASVGTAAEQPTAS